MTSIPMLTCTDYDLNDREKSYPVMTAAEFDARYKILEEAGSGENAIVYKALDTETDEVVAVKSIYFINELITACLLSESSLYTDSILGIKNWTPLRTARDIFIIMPYLKQTLSSLSGLDSDSVNCIIFELIVAITIMERFNVIHDDIKPENIMIRRADQIRCYTINNVGHYVNCPYQPVIIDFGEAYVTDFSDRGDWTNDEFDLGLDSIVKFLQNIGDYPLPPNVSEFGKNVDAKRAYLFSATFNYLREFQLVGVETVRFFEPMTI